MIMSTTRVRGLDALRFFCALWVIFGHVGVYPMLEGIDRSRQLGRVVNAVYNNLVSGPAAVIVFFVISGFCIHFPYRNSARVELIPFFARRHIRILTPVVAAVLAAQFLRINLPLLGDSILWSLVCEEVYYTIYPFLLSLRARFGWRPLIIVSYLLAGMVALTRPTAGNYASYGLTLNWVLGLPCWLLGCALAESHNASNSRPSPTTRQLWAWRSGILTLSVAASVLRFHTPLGYPWTLNLFALFVFQWLRKEILFAKERPVGVIERAGVFSYSMYLFHLHANTLWKLVPAQRLGFNLDWLMHMAFILGACYLFYLLVERPSHFLARSTYLYIAKHK